MATKNPRINVTIAPEIANVLAAMAKEKGKTISMTANGLIEQAIANHEDGYWSKLAEKREEQTKRWVSHKDAWK
jgi:predicted DNA-binding protein